MISSLTHSLHKVVPSRHRKEHVEDDILTLCSPVFLSPTERKSVSARLKPRRREVQHIDATIVELEAHLQRLFKRRDALRMKDSVARALLVYKDFAKHAMEDDVSVLSTVYVPDRKEANNIKTRTDARLRHIYCMQETIHMGEVDKVTQDCLFARITTMERANAVGSALLAPIRKLSAEVLGEIFVQTVPPLCLDIFIHYWRYRRTSLRRSDPHPHRVRDYLARVCRLWRIVVHETPRMWTTLVLDSPLSLDISPIAQCLANSKPCKIDIFMAIWTWFKPEHADHIKPILKLIYAERSRIRVFLSHGDVGEHLSYVFPRDLTTAVPSMEFFAAEKLDPAEADFPIGEVDAPELKEMVLLGANPSFTSASYQNLRHLIIGRAHNIPPPWPTCLKIFSLCPHLEVLRLSLPALDSYEPSAKVALPSLRKLTLRTRDPMAFTQILDSFDTPVLARLEVDAIIGHPSMSNVLGSLSDDAAASLKYLVLLYMSCVGEGVAEALRRLKNVNSIRCLHTNVDNVFFDALTPDDASESWTCPKLSNLILYKARLPGADLVRFLDTRTLPDSVVWRPQFLKRITVDECIGLEDLHFERLSSLRNTHSRSFKIFP